MSQVEWTERALKDAARLDQSQRERILQAIERLSATGHGDVKRVRGTEREWRLRVGDWRVRLEHRPGGTLVILRVLPRGAAYKP